MKEIILNNNYYAISINSKEKVFGKLIEINKEDCRASLKIRNRVVLVWFSTLKKVKTKNKFKQLRNDSDMYSGFMRWRRTHYDVPAEMVHLEEAFEVLPHNKETFLEFRTTIKKELREPKRLRSKHDPYLQFSEKLFPRSKEIKDNDKLYKDFVKFFKKNYPNIGYIVRAHIKVAYVKIPHKKKNYNHFRQSLAEAFKKRNSNITDYHKWNLNKSDENIPTAFMTKQEKNGSWSVVSTALNFDRPDIVIQAGFVEHAEATKKARELAYKDF